MGTENGNEVGRDMILDDKDMSTIAINASVEIQDQACRHAKKW
jgi:hypothetical protein